MMPINVLHYRLEPLSRLAQDFVAALDATLRTLLPKR
jgi:hypothetical protein